MLSDAVVGFVLMLFVPLAFITYMLVKIEEFRNNILYALLIWVGYSLITGTCYMFMVIKPILKMGG